MSQSLLDRAGSNAPYSVKSTTDFGVDITCQLVRKELAAQSGNPLAARIEFGLKHICDPAFFPTQAARFAAPGLAMPLHGADEENLALVAAQPLFYWQFLGYCGWLLKALGLEKQLEVMCSPQ